MKLPFVTDYQGSAFHYLPFITRYLWQQEVLEKHEMHTTHLPQRSSTSVWKRRNRERERESKWCRKNMNCVGKWVLWYAILLSISQLYEFADWIVWGCFQHGCVWVEECRLGHLKVWLVLKVMWLAHAIQIVQLQSAFSCVTTFNLPLICSILQLVITNRNEHTVQKTNIGYESSWCGLKGKTLCHFNYRHNILSPLIGQCKLVVFFPLWASVSRSSYFGVSWM